MMEKIIQQGAEAVLIRRGERLLKRRVDKGYRIKELDEKIRKLRTRSEAKLLEKVGKIIPAPKVLKVDERKTEIEMEFIDGDKISEKLDTMKNWEKVCFEIGKNIAFLHDAGIIHGDLTTSNMIWVEQGGSRPTANLKKQLRELKKLNLPEKEYAIFCSGSMAVRGIRDSRDLDILVKQHLWDELSKKYKVSDGQFERDVRIKIGSIEIYKNFKPWFEDTDKLIDDSDVFDGKRFVKLEHVLTFKRMFNREKDRKDLELIENYLAGGKLYFIDFGLGFANGHVEDKAVDLHLIKQALEAKHFSNWEKYWRVFLDGCRKSSKQESESLRRLEKVEKRGRYKQNY